ncbi:MULTISPECIES: DUF2262 domain-containing protein [Paenibacillus]|uniref:DUF2262 domain-containing protein n=1 Tax=Paenibacillus TaxID=44249 RepID=UPI0022B93CF1|nr:DUF2262 domain-containing protein [Paenibacillus caseinilyticus]MCZ8519750.1 DUF2262 domain-containing protein [Paenibacillus caseinilyticus]
MGKGKEKEIQEFNARFDEEIVEIAGVTEACGVGAGKGMGQVMWNPSINLIAWKRIGEDEPLIRDRTRLEWLVSNSELSKAKEVLQANSLVRLRVRIGEKSLMFIEVLDPSYQDNELNVVLEESFKPVFYHDEILGPFELDKSIDLFEKEVQFDGGRVELYFEWQSDENQMKLALQTAYSLFGDQEGWNKRLKAYAADELLDLANDWLEQDDEPQYEEITQEIFINSIKIWTISVYPEGNFTVYYSDGDLFGGHSICVTGNISGELESAHI